MWALFWMQSSCLIALPDVTAMPGTSVNEMVGLVLAFVVIAGGFSWYYLARTHQGTTEEGASGSYVRGQ